MESVSVVIVHHEGERILDSCLRSIEIQASAPMETIVVDNASSDGSIQACAASHPWFRVVTAERNLGFALGANLGVSEARGDLVLLLNDDAELGPGALGALSEGFAGRQGLVLEGAEMTSTGDVALSFALSIAGCSVACRHRAQVAYPSGACVMFRRSEIGQPFVAPMEAYGEDVYLGLSARLRGLSVEHCEAARYRHLGGASYGQIPAAGLTFQARRNQYLNLILILSWPSLLAVAPVVTLDVVARLAAGLAGRGHRLNHPVGLVRAVAWIAVHPRRVWRLRRQVQAGRRVGDRRLLEVLTPDLRAWEGGAGPAWAARVLNSGSRAYCRLIGLPLDYTNPA
jgi:GT2 family glycosyltransferase